VSSMPSSRKFVLAVKTWGSDEAIHSWKYLKAHILQVGMRLLCCCFGKGANPAKRMLQGLHLASSSTPSSRSMHLTVLMLL
jgi:hypothetical protein